MDSHYDIAAYHCFSSSLDDTLSNITGLILQAKERRDQELAEVEKADARPASAPAPEQLQRAETRAQEMLQRRADLKHAPEALLEQRRQRQQALAQQVLHT